MRRWFKFPLLFFFTLSFWPAWPTLAQVKTACYWTSPSIPDNPKLIREIAKTDLLIIDLENMFNNFQTLTTIKSLNANLRLICYSNPMEMFSGDIANRPQQNRWRKKLEERQKWLLKSGDEPAVFYKGMQMLNLSASCPKIDGQTYAEWMAEELAIILDNRIWDGYFMDNSGANIAWLYKNKIQVDADGIGTPDQDSLLDLNWSKGIRLLIQKIRAIDEDFIIIGNKGSLDNIDLFDGKMFERFPNDYLGEVGDSLLYGKLDDGWHQCLKNAKKTGKYTIFQVRPSDLNFGVISSLMLDNIYVSVGTNNFYDYPEFHQNLGKALGPFSFDKNTGTATRQWNNGKILIRPAEKFGEILTK